MNADAGDGHMILQGSLPAGVYAPCHALVPHLTATLREQDDFASNYGHVNAREMCHLCRRGLAITNARYSIPQQSPLRIKPYWRRCIRPIHAFLPTITFLRPH